MKFVRHLVARPEPVRMDEIRPGRLPVICRVRSVVTPAAGSRAPPARGACQRWTVLTCVILAGRYELEISSDLNSTARITRMTTDSQRRRRDSPSASSARPRVPTVIGADDALDGSPTSVIGIYFFAR